MTKPIDDTVIRAPRPRGRTDLYHTMDGYDWIYESDVSKVDVCKPGFFNTYRDEMRDGAIIECRLGHYADGITQVWLQVIDASRKDHDGNVLVSVGPSKKFTTVRHDGALADEKEAA